jgi:hypothetical protein
LPSRPVLRRRNTTVAKAMLMFRRLDQNHDGGASPRSSSEANQDRY